MENKGGNRREETIMTRIGHNKLIASSYYGEYPTGFCDQCQIPETRNVLKLFKLWITEDGYTKDIEKIVLTGCGVKNNGPCSRKWTGNEMFDCFLLTKTNDKNMITKL